MSDLKAGLREIVTDVDRVITNAESMALKSQMPDKECLDMAVIMLKAARRMVERGLKREL